MLAADTNVWARAYLNDEAVQARKARSALAEARTARGVFVPLLVLAELSWVLRGKWDRESLEYDRKPPPDARCNCRITVDRFESFGGSPKRGDGVCRSPHCRDFL